MDTFYPAIFSAGNGSKYLTTQLIQCESLLQRIDSGVLAEVNLAPKTQIYIVTHKPYLRNFGFKGFQEYSRRRYRYACRYM